MSCNTEVKLKTGLSLFLSFPFYEVVRDRARKNKRGNGQKLWQVMSHTVQIIDYSCIAISLYIQDLCTRRLQLVAHQVVVLAHLITHCLSTLKNWVFSLPSN